MSTQQLQEALVWAGFMTKTYQNMTLVTIAIECPTGEEQERLANLIYLGTKHEGES